MRNENRTGLTLVELVISITILGIIATATHSLVSPALQAQDHANKRSSLHYEGLMIMTRMTEAVRLSTHVQIPNAHNPVRDILAVSGFENDDNDFYFDDPLFPRIDEDLWRDMNNDGKHGIAGVDDNGDFVIDPPFPFNDYDDDEDQLENEDDFDGLDNEGDGNVDEDTWADMNMDWQPGVAGMDDDGDGTVDEGHENDDDEDGTEDEDPINEVIFYISGGTNLHEYHHGPGDDHELSTRVTLFQVTHEAPERLAIGLELTDDDGEKAQFYEYVYVTNVYQRFGKRVR